VRRGAAGLLKLVPNGVRAGGRPKWSGPKLARVAAHLRADPEGTRRAAALFGSARRAALRVADATARGRWDRTSALALEGWALAGALGELATLVARARFRARRARRCAVLQAVARGRLVEGDRAAWLASVARDHVVHSQGP
jgi:hypothetical protein